MKKMINWIKSLFESRSVKKEKEACKKALQVLSQINSSSEFSGLEETPGWSSWLADCILHNRFKPGEPAIATNAWKSLWYAEYILHGRFELGEAAIATSAEYSYLYAKYVLHGRFELGEAAIKGSSYEEDYRELVQEALRTESVLNNNSIKSNTSILPDLVKK